MTTTTRPLHALPFLAALLWLGLHAAPARAEEEKVLNVYNWAEYIGDDTVKKFEAETGIRVRYDTYDSNEVLLTKLVAGRSGYDVVVPSSDFGATMIAGGLLQRLDRSKLDRWSNLDPAVMRLLSKVDPGNEYLVPWLGGSVTVGYNVDKVKAVLGSTPIPDDPFELLFNPAYASRLKACGISVLDSASDVFPSALIYLGRKPYGRDAGDYADAAALLQKIRPSITLFSSLGYIADLAEGSLCVALGYSGDFNNARLRARQAGRPVNIATPLPPRGMQFGYESMAIPLDAPHPGNALKWINFILRPEIQAEITDKVMFTSPNLAARKFIRPEVLQDPMTFPPEEYLRSKAFFYEPRNNDTRRTMTRLFTRLKTGT